MKKLILFSISMTLLLAGCSSDREGNFQIYLTDQAIDNAEAILVNISEISVQKEGEGFLTVWSGEQTYDLLKLRNKEEQITDVTLEAGTYTQIRLIVDSGEIVIAGQTYEMTVSSSEVKIPAGFQVMEGGATKLVLDFEADNSIHVVNPGHRDGYILRPVIIVKSISY